MNPSEYREEIRKASEGELIGEALFLRLAPAYAPEDREKLAAMARLESVTGGLLDELLSRHGIEAAAPTVLAEATESLTERLLGLPWRDLMARFSEGFRPYVAIYDRLEEHAQPQDRDALAFLARQERLLLEFVEAERTGDGSPALEKIEALVAGKLLPAAPRGQLGQEPEEP